MKYDFKKIESKWQKEWQKTEPYKAKDFSKKPKYYGLFEFPYPSGDGLHVGHIRPYVGMDVIVRKRRMQGYNVLFPIGWDAFGLPTENYAIKTGIQPAIVTKKNSDNFKRQFKSLGISLDWDREVNTTDPNYYRWTQWIFLKLFENGLAYKAKMPINWCSSCKIGLANEEVVAGKCERCGHIVEQRNKEQWMLKITAYADKLLSGLEGLDFLPEIKASQKNWIGRSEGALLKFPVLNSDFEIEVFTTRPETIFGATYLVLAPEHKILEKLKSRIANLSEVEAYLTETKKKTEEDRLKTEKQKTGVELKGVLAVNPANREHIPIFVADYVLASYGSGAIMAVPAHDGRDFEFAKKFNLQIKRVIEPKISKVILKKENFKDSFAVSVPKEWTLTQRPGAGNHLEISGASVNDIFEFLKKHFSEGLYYVYSEGTDKKILFHSDSGETKAFDLGSVENLKNAKNYGLMIGIKKEELSFDDINAFYGDSGILVNSMDWSGKSSEEVKWSMVSSINGRKEIKYKLRDWIFSRQRYWGEPIPLVYCDNCSARVKTFGSRSRGEFSEGEILNPGWVSVSEKDLPVKLPKVKNFKPGENGESPLAGANSWIWIKCPRCKAKARRETDVMPNWAGSSWYFLAYAMGGKPAYESKKGKFWNNKVLKYWMPVDWYNGGMEHVTLHLLYSRFWNQFLSDIQMVPTKEPYKKRTAHGLILAQGGVKMSKSKGNIVNPDLLIKEFGADALRVYEMFIGPFEQAIAWDERGILGTFRFLSRIWDYFEVWQENYSKDIKKDKGNIKLYNSEKIEQSVHRELHRAIKKVGEDIESMSFNTAISALMIFVNKITAPSENASSKFSQLTIPQLKNFLIIISPFAPHMAEELWERIMSHELRIKGNINKKITSINFEKWPKFDEKIIEEDSYDLVIQINGKLKDRVRVSKNSPQADVEKLVLGLDKIRTDLGSQKPKRIIFVPGRLVNIVV